MKLIKGMSYRQWQKQNKEYFNSINKTQQKEARQKGYCNIGWDRVQNSWEIIYKFYHDVPSLFEHKLHKGDVIGAIEISLLTADKAKHLARQAIRSLNKSQQCFDKLADETLAKYPLL